MPAGPLSFSRREDHRVLAGVAGGFADQHGVDPTVVRGALVVLSFVGGLGLVLYAVGFLVADPAGVGRTEPSPPDRRRDLSVGCITLGLTLVVRSTGLWLGDPVMVPLVVLVAGVVVLGVVQPSAVARRGGDSHLVALADGRHAGARLVAGAVLVAVGLGLVGAAGGVSSGLRVGAFATALTVLGLGVLLGPWIARVVQEATEERRQRIRAEEREAMAAHLHDSVLQTLALIQRTADDPRRTVTLARQQERELRQWLYGSAAPAEGMLANAVREVAAEVERTYHVRADVVVVGDRPLDEVMGALAAATREACVNAAKHSGTDEVSVYVEVGTMAVDVFVRDRGRGFDRGSAAPDRRGIAGSIVARLERVGGTAVIDSAVGAGTEVHLRVPVDQEGT